MTIAEQTTMQAYQLNKGGARARLAILRQMARESLNNRNEATRLHPDDWKGARRYTLSSWRNAYCAGIHQAPGQWYTHGGEQFRNERDAHDVMREAGRHRAIDHTGWYTDTECNEKAIGIVASLPHGRFIAGYRWTSNDERVYFPEVFTDEEEAARAADDHAERFADGAREDDARWNAMQEAEWQAEKLGNEVQRLFLIRNNPQCTDLPGLRRDLRAAIEELRAARDDVRRTTNAYERG